LGFLLINFLDMNNPRPIGPMKINNCLIKNKDKLTNHNDLLLRIMLEHDEKLRPTFIQLKKTYF